MRSPRQHEQVYHRHDQCSDIHVLAGGAFVSRPLYCLLAGFCSQGAKAFLLCFRVSFKSGKCLGNGLVHFSEDIDMMGHYLMRTSFIVEYCTQWRPSAVYVSLLNCVAMNLSLFRRREAISMNTRNAVSLNPKPFGSGSQ